MPKTINGLTVTSSAAAGDFVPIWRASNADTRKITKANFIGATLTGGGTIATGGNNLTLSGTSTINGTISGGGTLATGGFTLTVPATGTAALLGTTQTFSAAKTFSSLITASAGITFGSDTLADYDEGTWTPALTLGGSNTGIVHTTQNGFYTRIGDIVYAECDVRISSKGSATGALKITGLPFNAFGNRSISWVRWANMATSYLSMYVLTSNTSTELSVAGSGAAATTHPTATLDDGDLTNTSTFVFTLIYKTNA